jgi:4-hydroxy-3-methylbut-2-enyl diphosphate reductase
VALLDQRPVDLMIVIGGYNSSNTCNLARICAARVRTLHIADPACLISKDEVRYRPVGPPSTTAGREEVARDWLSPAGPITIGLTAGASTPNNIVGQVIRRLEEFCTS